MPQGIISLPSGKLINQDGSPLHRDDGRRPPPISWRVIEAYTGTTLPEILTTLLPYYRRARIAQMLGINTATLCRWVYRCDLRCAPDGGDWKGYPLRLSGTSASSEKEQLSQLLPKLGTSPKQESQA